MEAEGIIERFEKDAHAAEARALESAEDARDAWARLTRVSRSSSWRVTAPLRGLMKVLSRGGKPAGGSVEESPTPHAPVGETMSAGLTDLPESAREVLADLEWALSHRSE